MIRPCRSSSGGWTCSGAEARLPSRRLRVRSLSDVSGIVVSPSVALVILVVERSCCAGPAAPRTRGR